MTKVLRFAICIHQQSKPQGWGMSNLMEKLKHKIKILYEMLVRQEQSMTLFRN